MRSMVGEYTFVFLPEANPARWVKILSVVNFTKTELTRIANKFEVRVWLAQALILIIFLK
jgi:hypothetical protein